MSQPSMRAGSVPHAVAMNRDSSSTGFRNPSCSATARALAT
ncbi:hypothetical protein [Streptomyces ambofaciens]